MHMRHEWKHEITPMDALVIRQRMGVLGTLDPHARNGCYHIRSLYFDNVADKALREKLDGVDCRQKWRIRLYGGDIAFIRLERDPTKFCTYEEFQTGVDTLREFCELRTQSVQGQLDGTIPSTSEGQQEDSSTLVDASGLTVSNMGSMGNGNGGAGGGGPQDQDGERPSDFNPSDQGGELPDGFTLPDQEGGQSSGFTPPDQDGERPSGFTPPDGSMQPASANALGGWIAVGASVAVLACGIGIALLFRRP